jgi:hypothetical protein
MADIGGEADSSFASDMQKGLEEAFEEEMEEVGVMIVV